MKPCPCGTKKAYFECCYIFISGDQIAPTPESLMRSRYSAYSEANMDYIEATMKDRALMNFNKDETRDWAKSVQWQGLEVIRTKEKNNKGSVEFVAAFRENNEDIKIHEISEFFKENGIWFYVNGITHG